MTCLVSVRVCMCAFKNVGVSVQNGFIEPYVLCAE